MPLLLTESKQSIINLGFPDIIASLIQQKFGKYAYIVANWYKQYKGAGYIERHPNEWFKLVHCSFGKGITLYDLIMLYNATFKGDVAYKKKLNDLELTSSTPVYTDYILEEERKELVKEIEEYLFKKDIFFKTFDIITDISSGKLKNLGPYKDLRFLDAVEKYEEKRIFSDKHPIKTYPSGYKWIEVGPRSEIVAKYMANCGSCGLMNFDDSDRTIVALFSSENKPHVITTYCPNLKLLTQEQSAASSSIKDEYIDYLIDLSKELNSKIDIGKSKSKLLKIKYLLGDKLKSIKRIKSEVFHEYFVFQLISGEIYFTNGEMVISYADVKQAILRRNSIDFKPTNVNVHGIQSMFNHLNIQDYKNNGVEYIPLTDFK